MLTAFAVLIAILSVRLIAKSSIPHKVAYTGVAVGCIGIASNIGDPIYLNRSLAIVAVAFLIFMIKGKRNGSDSSNTGL